jgi:hypothetical protein
MTSLYDECSRENLKKSIADKPTNPKELIGDTKCPTAFVPSTVMIEVAMAYLEGALKYGQYNWRGLGVKASTYKSAHDRHVAKWWNGENCDKDTRIKHLASAIACLGIILDAEACGKLTDDRPPAIDLASLLERQEKLVAHLKGLFKDHSPKHWTIADDEQDRQEETHGS